MTIKGETRFHHPQELNCLQQQQQQQQQVYFRLNIAYKACAHNFSSTFQKHTNSEIQKPTDICV